MMKAYERFLKYVSVWTTSDETSETVPSTKRQFDLGRLLAQELKDMGVEKVELNDMCYLYAEIPATPGCEEKPAIGLVAHMDTAMDFPGHDIHPQIIADYDGEDVKLGESGRVLSVKEFPHLKDMKGRTLITTDGTTLLGADDKAGIAEILTAVDEVLKEGMPHGKICIGFTPDEEIARGAKNFDVERFDADYAYTLDGDIEGEIQFENFNASTACFTIHGVNVHTGSAKGILVNSQLIGMEIQSMLPDERPETTEGYEGFFHLMAFNGNTEKTQMRYFVRDHSKEKFAERHETLRRIQKAMNDKYGEGTVELEIAESYYNMREKIEPCMHLVETAKKAITDAGLTPDVSPVRGGTDGARLSFKGLPCPNLGTGGSAFHGPYEHITVEGMDLVVGIVKDILKSYAAYEEK